ncbi:BgTH12-02698 [Blumeria graminis f. sp. triticale]|uniref:BgTH12-02698 n=1 Tax=Blumeria graminis f. sp. triticale TaxID=1689686 RepID=A0A9W4D6X1_BLUGR|nr:BgTH12-02698 [Blumeria graminis f. sp. triticale]
MNIALTFTDRKATAGLLKFLEVTEVGKRVSEQG